MWPGRPRRSKLSSVEGPAPKSIQRTVLGLRKERAFRQRMQIYKTGKREGERALGPSTALSHMGHQAAQLCQPQVGRGVSEPATPSGSDQFYGSADNPAKSVLTSGTARITPWGRDPRVALAVKCDHPPVVWGICSLYDVPNSTIISVPFLIDTGAGVTVIPETNWPPHWKLEDALMVGGVWGLTRARKSAQLVAITLHTEKGPEKIITLFPYVMTGVPPLLGRDTLALLKARVTNLL